MTITREDLAAAAAVGVLQYRQIDPLLVFLLQRDVRARRIALAQGRRPRRSVAVVWLSYLAGLLALITVTMFAVLIVLRTPHSLGSGTFLAIAALYLLGAIRVAFWFRKRGYCARLRIVAALAMVSVPLVVLVAQQVTG